MKAKLKVTGEIIALDEDKPSLLDYARGIFYDYQGNRYKRKELEFIPEFYDGIDWEQRRYEIAKTALHGNLTCPIIDGVDPNPSIESLAKWAVKIADALITELKKGGTQ